MIDVAINAGDRAPPHSVRRRRRRYRDQEEPAVMRMSCNGCRVLRKGCSGDCTIRPCLQWIKSPESQSRATLFLAKFYGRAGLLNLVSSGPDHLRPELFRSLLYDACGRIVDPVHGSVGLMWSGNWKLCQAAVEAVLRGDPIVPAADSDADPPAPEEPNYYDIRHIAKGSGCRINNPSTELHKVSKARFKRFSAAANRVKADDSTELPARWSPAPEEEDESAFSMETAEGGSHVSQGEQVDLAGDVELDLTLGMNIAGVDRRRRVSPELEADGLMPDACWVDLGLRSPPA